MGDSSPAGSTAEQSSVMSRQRQWYIALRWQEYEGEGRANLLRIIAVGAFYSVHLLSHFQIQLQFLQLGEGIETSGEFHRSVTTLAVTWIMVALAVMLCLRSQIFPHWLKYLSTGCDLVLLTSMLCVASGPRSPLVVGYFLVLVLAALRMSLPLVRFATAGGLLGYLWVLGCAKWPQAFGKGDLDLRVPRYEQIMTLLAIALAGLMLGQILRRVRSLGDDLVRRATADQPGDPS